MSESELAFFLDNINFCKQYDVLLLADALLDRGREQESEKLRMMLGLSPKKEKNYYQEAKEDAKECATNFLDQIVEQLLEDKQASSDLNNDYPDGDSYHHENHTDKYYNLQQAALVLDQLRSYTEGDEGLWERQSPEDAISTMAAYTYGNCVDSLWDDLITNINSDSTLMELLDNREDQIEKGNEVTLEETKIKELVEELIKDF